ncbi:hypothetical protein V5799_017144 [Amblyomma americanum]|uniref:Reverse transcriptase domain-containing protein n=1 Tax=Amblyomma americanum TaxID=6943 RepID=A0AAQ4F343_AMBAM
MYPAVWRPPPPRPICYYCGIRGHVARVFRRRQRDERNQNGHFRKDETYSSYGYRPACAANGPHHDDTYSSYPYRLTFLPFDHPRFSSPSPSPDRSSNVRPVVAEFVAIQRLSWIASGFFSECQTGYRRHRCTADSIADLVSCLEEAKQQGDVALLVLLDVQAAFDSHPTPASSRPCTNLE